MPFRLHVAGHRTRNEKIFSPSNIQQMLSNPAYRGNFRFLRKGLKGKLKISLPGPDSEVVTYSAPSIIDEATWEKARREMSARTGHKTALVFFPISGFATLPPVGCAAAVLFRARALWPPRMPPPGVILAGASVMAPRDRSSADVENAPFRFFTDAGLLAERLEAARVGE